MDEFVIFLVENCNRIEIDTYKKGEIKYGVRTTIYGEKEFISIGRVY